MGVEAGEPIGPDRQAARRRPGWAPLMLALAAALTTVSEPRPALSSPAAPSEPSAAPPPRQPQLSPEQAPPTKPGIAAPVAGLRRLVSVAAEPGRFLAWPANAGLWRWSDGREILVGFIEGPWLDKPDGHKVGHPQQQRLARSLDGGLSWSVETPEPFVGREGPLQDLRRPIRLQSPDLAIRVVGDGRDRPDARLGRFFVSMDRGHSWQGPFRFNGLERAPQLRGLLLTSRTSVRVTGPDSAQLLLSARDPRLGRHSNRLDKPFVAETRDGGISWSFVSWVVPWSDPYRAVMPSLVDLGGGQLVVALRRRDPRAQPESPSWIDAYGSDDDGRSWRFLSRVGETGVHNGNPPALARLPDGRLACVYADRSRQAMLLRLSGDQGRSWGAPLLIRTNPFHQDMGYPQLTLNHRGELVAIYYLATAERPHSHLEAAILRP